MTGGCSGCSLGGLGVSGSVVGGASGSSVGGFSGSSFGGFSGSDGGCGVGISGGSLLSGGVADGESDGVVIGGIVLPTLLSPQATNAQQKTDSIKNTANAINR